MNTKKQLIIGMSLLFLFVISFYGIIIINYKNKELLIPRIEKKTEIYIKDTYNNIYNNLNINKIKYNNLKKQYEVKVSSKENKHLYFIVSYKNNKFKSTYEKDYINGISLLNYYENLFLNKLSKSKIYTDTNIKFTKKLNKYTHIVQQALINNDNVNNLPVYVIKTNTIISSLDKDNITSAIMEYYKFIKSNKLKPKYYSIILTNKNDITNSLEINNLSEELIINNLNDIINGIISNNSDILNKYNINYKYIN